MKVGFAGTPSAMTEAQREAVRTILRVCSASEFHHEHGGGGGADGQAVAIASDLGIRVVCHAPSDLAHRAGCERCECDEVLVCRQRGRSIEAVVSSVDLLIAAPRGKETPRSRAWRAIRLARDAPSPRPHVVAWPDGSLSCGPEDSLGCFLLKDHAACGGSVVLRTPNLPVAMTREPASTRSAGSHTA